MAAKLRTPSARAVSLGRCVLAPSALRAQGCAPLKVAPSSTSSPWLTAMANVRWLGTFARRGGHTPMRLLPILLVAATSCTPRVEPVASAAADTAAVDAPSSSTDISPIAPAAGEFETVSIYRLLAQPEAFDNQWVQTAGYPSYSWEGCSSLYPSEPDRLHHVFTNALGLCLELRDAPETTPFVGDRRIPLDDFNGAAFVVGVFHKDLSMLSMIGGSGFSEVARFEPMPRSDRQ